MKLYFYHFITCCTLISCVSQSPAPVEYNHNNDYTYEQYQKEINSKNSDLYLNKEENPVVTSLPFNEDKIVRTRLEIKQEKLKYPEGILVNPHKKINDNIVKPSPKIVTIPKLVVKEEIIQEKKDLNKHQTDKFIKPIDGKIISKFGEDTIFGKNKGMNIEAEEGSSVKSIASGEIIYSGMNKNFGNLIIVKIIDSNKYIAYAHLNDLMFVKNNIVTEGQIIGHVGRTGKTSSPQLYLAIKIGDKAVDPMDYINF
jgi:murein DD-endopeptidase MepM/ murein hydrolase activator NlpD